MSNRIDQLFKDALSEHKVAPSAEAWTKVQSGISKKNKLVISWRMAAVFVLFGTLIGTWYFLTNNEAIATIQLTEKNEIGVPKNNVVEKPRESARDNSKTNVAQKTNQTNNTKSAEIIRIKKEIESSSTKNIAMENSGLQKTIEDHVIATEPILIVESVKPEKPTVIEFILEPIAKEPSTAVAKITEEESSGLKKILETALDVKNGDSDLSIIRDTKNQLFALDFKKDKTKRN